MCGYYMYFKGRTFRPRLELSASGIPAQHGEVNCLVCTVILKSVGLSRLDIIQKGSGLRVSESNVSLFSPIQAAGWEARKVFSTFERHDWIEPGESIEDQIMFGLPRGSTIMKLDFRIVGKRQSWFCSSIVDCCFDTLTQQAVSSALAAAPTCNNCGDGDGASENSGWQISALPE